MLEGCLCESVLFWSTPVESESIVYGCIRDWPGDSMERRMRRAANRRVEIYISADEEMIRQAEAGTLQ